MTARIVVLFGGALLTFVTMWLGVAILDRARPSSPTAAMCRHLADMTRSLQLLEAMGVSPNAASYWAARRELVSAAAGVSDAAKLEWCCEHGLVVPSSARLIGEAVADYEATMGTIPDGAVTVSVPHEAHQATQEIALRVTKLVAYLDCPAPPD